MKNILIILAILIGINFLIMGICNAFTGSTKINLSTNIILGELK